ncbi:MAG: hypothetical protein LAN71_02535 [Acidobacteriia bacterium]|nr:hypothetical protein [Terriglobia bacterium]
MTMALVILAGALSAAGDNFTPGCPVPYGGIQQQRPIDGQCGLAGAAENPASAAQDKAKNNLCASGSAVPLTISAFDELQQAAEEKGVTFGNQHVPHPEPLPADRSVLKDLIQSGGAPVGEGTMVVYVGFILKTKIASKEGVNCHLPGKAANDIHIVMGKRPDDAECNSVTAEMIPHFRPASWDKITFAAVMAKLKKHPVRISGQMFFDASHAYCGHPEFLPMGDPHRRSLWEIHPVYALDVCRNKTLAGCKVDKDAVWTAFDSWVQNPQ